jgi:hypothetical protein
MYSAAYQAVIPKTVYAPKIDKKTIYQEIEELRETVQQQMDIIQQLVAEMKELKNKINI